MKFQDSMLAYFLNQLDNLDPKLHEPLYSVSWGRDIKLRSGISMGNESTSFIRTTIGGIGTQKATGKPWISPDTTTLPGVSVDGERITQPLRLLGREISYSSIELERSQQLGMSIDTQKYEAMNVMYQMSTDEMVYIGDTDVGATGLLNNAGVTVSPVANDGTGPSTLWSTKTPDQILRDINEMLESCWAGTGYSICPDKLLLPPAQYAYLVATKLSTDGNISILSYLEQNTISLKVNGRALDIRPVKWLTGRGVAGVDRMVAYTNMEDKVRFPMVPIRRETPYYLGIKFNAPYIWIYGEVEIIYPECIQYRDGI